MSFPYVYPNGLGYSLGDITLTQGALYSSGRVYYVDNSNAQASNSNPGTMEAYPWLTLVYALSQAAAGSVIVVGATHSETITTVSHSTARISVIGAGSSAGDPTATLTFTTQNMSFSGDDLFLANLKIVGTAVAGSALISVSGDRFNGRNLLFNLARGVVDTFGMSLSGNTARIEQLKIVSTSAAGTGAPEIGLYDNTQVRMDLISPVVDNGVAGFEFAAIQIDGPSGKQVYIENATQLRGADISVGSSNVGRIGVGSSTGQSLVNIT